MRRAVVATIVSGLVVYGVAEAGAPTAAALALTGWALFCVVGWLAFDVRDVTVVGPAPQLAWIGAVTVIALAATGVADPLSGSLAQWYADLPLAAVQTVSADVALLTLALVLFLLATSNRIVRLVLAAAGTLPIKESPSCAGAGSSVR
jgi:hypothetical protein